MRVQFRTLLFAILILPLGAFPPAPAQSVAAAEIPWIKQKTNSDCGRAVLASLGSRNGGDPEAAYSKIPDPHDTRFGYSLAELMKYGARLGIDLNIEVPPGVNRTKDCKPTLSVERFMAELKRKSAEGRPMIVPVHMPDGRAHYLVLVPSKGAEFAVLDPATPERRTLGAAALGKMMCRFGYVALIAD